MGGKNILSLEAVVLKMSKKKGVVYSICGEQPQYLMLRLLRLQSAAAKNNVQTTLFDDDFSEKSRHHS